MIYLEYANGAKTIVLHISVTPRFGFRIFTYILGSERQEVGTDDDDQHGILSYVRKLRTSLKRHSRMIVKKRPEAVESSL